MMKKNIQVKTRMLDLYCITPDHLRNVADLMESDGIEYIEFDFDAGYNNVDITEYSTRQETDQEYEARLKKEKAYKKEKEYAQAKKKQKMIIEARKMGLTVANVDPIPSNYEHVYWVPKGIVIEDWVVDKDGYVWYDEAGLLGAQKVYGTAKKANEGLEQYVKNCLQ